MIELITKTNLDFSIKTETMGTTNNHGTLINLDQKKNVLQGELSYFMHILFPSFDVRKIRELIQSVNPKLKPNVYNEVRQFISWSKCASL